MPTTISSFLLFLLIITISSQIIAASGQDDVQTEFPVQHIVKGTYKAEILPTHVWHPGYCQAAGVYLDFYIDVNEAHADDNLFIELVGEHFNETRAILPNGVELRIYYDRIPIDRKSEWKSLWTTDGEFSVALNSRDLRKGRYYISVKCGDILGGGDLPFHFGLFAEFIHAEVTPGHPDLGDICRNELLYHYLPVTEDEVMERKDVEFTVCTPEGADSQLTILSKVHLPPIRIAAPMKHVNRGGGCSSFKVCNSELEVSFWMEE